MVSRRPTIISLFQRPDVIADASLHRRRYAQGLMDAGDAGEVVEHVVKRHGASVVLDFLAECVGKPSKAPHVHPHR